MTSLDDSHGPGFGPALRSEWLLDERWTYLNHGTVGAPPRRVHEAQAALRAEIERQPAIFMLRELPPTSRLSSRSSVAGCGLRQTRSRRSSGSSATNWPSSTTSPPVPTQSSGRSVSGPGDEILVASLGYGGITRAVQYVADRSGATVRTVEMPAIGARPEAFVDAVRLALTPSVKLAVVDHIAATAAAVPAHRRDRGGLSRCRRPDPRRRGACARRDPARHPVARCRLLRRQSPQVGVDAAQRRDPVGVTRSLRAVRPSSSRGASATVSPPSSIYPGPTSRPRS
ncbi:MAG: hypothetical protein R2705_08460 [Ilumatobacteraceae bacterium]